MKKTTTLLALAAGTALLTACGSATDTPIAPVAAPQVAVPSSTGPTGAPASAGAAVAPVPDPGASVEVDDQSGDGRSVVVREVRLSGGPGWVVIRTDDDDDDGRVLGAAAVQPGRSGPVTVTLTEPVPGSGDDDLTAVLHLDDGDGVFDERTDPAVLDEDDDDGDRDDARGDDVEDDDFDYRIA